MQCFIFVCYRKITILKKNVLLDKNVIRDLEQEQQKYLLLAVECYLKCLVITSKHHLHIYQVVKLWLENNSSQKINELVSILLI